MSDPGDLATSVPPPVGGAVRSAPTVTSCATSTPQAGDHRLADGWLTRLEESW